MFTQLTGLKKRQVFALLMFTNLTACSWLFPASYTKGQAPFEVKTNTVNPPAKTETPAAPVESKPEVSASKANEQILKDNYNSSRAQKQMEVQKIQVERHFQRVVRRDCDNNVLSDKEETVQSPTFDFKLKAPNWSKFKAVYVYNDTTGADELAEMPIPNLPIIGLLADVTGSGRFGIKIKGDIAQAWLTFHMAPGLNNVFVEYFYDCSPKSIPGSRQQNTEKNNCVESKEKILVHYPIAVDYQEKHLNGILEVKADPKTCVKK